MAIYDVGNPIPQITGNIDMRIAAANVPFEPIRSDPTMYKSIMENEIDKQKLQLSREELQYKKDVLNNNIEQYWQDENSKLVGNLLGYNSGFMEKAKKGEIDTPGIAFPYYSKMFEKYNTELNDLYKKYPFASPQFNKEARQVLLKKVSDKEFRNSNNAAVTWNNTLNTINDISNGKNKTYTNKNIDWVKFNAVTDKLNNENIPVDPNELNIRNFIIEDKDKLIENAITNNTVINKETRLEQEGRKDLSRTYETGISPMDMYKNAFDELSKNTALISQLGNGFKYNEATDEEIPLLVQDYISNEVLKGINKKLGTNYTINDLPTEPFNRMISQSSFGTSVETTRQLQTEKTQNQKDLFDYKENNQKDRNYNFNYNTKSIREGMSKKEVVDLNYKIKILQDAINDSDLIIPDYVGKQLIDAKINDISNYEILEDQSNDNVKVIKITSSEISGGENKELILRLPTKKALQEEKVQNVLKNNLIKKYAQDDPLIAVEAAAFLNNTELQDAYYRDEMLPYINDVANKLRKYDPNKKYSDNQLIWIAHHTGLENGINYLQGKTSTSANTDDFKELERGFPIISKIEANGVNDWLEIVKSPGLEGTDGYDNIYTGGQPSSALGIYQIPFISNRDNIKAKAEEMGIDLSNYDLSVSKLSEKQIIKKIESDKKNILEYLKAYKDNYGDISDIVDIPADVLDEVNTWIDTNVGTSKGKENLTKTILDNFKMKSKDNSNDSDNKVNNNIWSTAAKNKLQEK